MRSTLIALSAATLFLALCGFECASTEMTTAKVAVRAKDYDKAELNLKKEVAARPQNGEAWSMLSEIYETKKEYPEMLDAQEKALAATQPALSDQEKANIYAKRYNAWLQNYNSARNEYLRTMKGVDTSSYQKALAYIQTASSVRPDYAENVYLRAAIYHEMKNQEMETKTNMAYMDAVRADVDKGLAAGLALGMPPRQVIAKLGKATKTELDSTGGYLYYAPNELYVYFDPPDQGVDTSVIGWKYYQGSPLPDRLREAPVYIRSAPYYTLGIDSYYDAESAERDSNMTKASASYDQALRYLQLVQKLDLEQDRVGQVVADIYGRTHRTDEARKAFEENIRQNPNDPSGYINYGTLLVGLKDYNAAITNFKKVLTIAKEGDEKYRTALFNLGAAYKNWGADLQNAAGDKPSAKQADEFKGKLLESVQYFEQYRKIQGSSDLVALAELANLYIVLEKKPELTKITSDLEALQSDNENNAQYWNVMSNIYLHMNEVKKSEAAMKKADALMK